MPIHSNAEYSIADWPKVRSVIGFFLRAQKPYTIFGHGEFDITSLLEKIEALKAKSQLSLSLNTYLIYALSRIAKRHEKSRTFKYRNKCIVFKNVNISIPILKTLPNGLKVPVMYIVRKADTKSLAELNREMKNAVKSDLSDDRNVKFRRALIKLPLSLQSLVYRFIFMNPVRANQYFGNMGITNLQLLGYSSPFIGLPPNVYACQFSIGNVTEKFLPDQDKKPVLRKILTIGAGMDHLVMDGLCIAALAKDLGALLEACEGIDEEFIQQSLSPRNDYASGYFHGNS